ncbi:MAG: nucleotidyltransferase family protein, partial [Acetobacteraceae bacterium]
MLRETLPALTPAEWDDFIRQSLNQGTAGLTCQRLLDDAGPLLPPEVAAACRSYLAASAAAFAQGLRELRAALAALAEAAIPAVPFKGPGLAAQIYPHPALARFRDLDLLVPPPRHEAALAVLESLGYRSDVGDLSPWARRAYHRYNGQDILFAPERLPVEPHWALAPRTFGPAPAVAPMLARAVPRPAPNGAPLPSLTPEDTLLVAALHGAKEEWARLIWIADIAAILAAWPGLDAETLLARARGCGCRRMVALAVLLAGTLLGAPVPAPLAAAADRAAHDLARRVRDR